ncbi:hypothetical protein [Salipiger marinus]|uniref:Uncharacterized protein n=1 Tax=Salipiger marinus TaxID=555512 RepID=A0A1G8MRZ8_9RHOB|nr:hypothetical protein [Salipiger marinus]SDI70646.1 hypothetical protein SAMN04487993_1008229 [Salipiger marinus]
MIRSLFDAVRVTLAATVAHGETFTAGYPEGRSAVDYIGGGQHVLVSGSHRTLFAASGDFAVAFGPSEIVVTIYAGQVFGAGETVHLNLDRAEGAPGESLASPGRMMAMEAVRFDLGAPVGSDSDGVCASQDGAAGAPLLLNGVLASESEGVATFDVPRNVVAAWTGAAVLTVTGTDEFGDTVVESSGSGTSMIGKKAFKTVTSVVPSASITAATVGNSKVLGLPAFLAATVDVLAEIEDGAAATPGTLVPGVTAAATASTGDVRGTYSPDSNPDGSKNFELTVLLRSVSAKGVEQFEG